MSSFRTWAKAAAASAALTLAAAPAFAVTVQNDYDKALDVKADHGAEEPTTRIEAGKSARIDCDGCELRVPTSGYGVHPEKGDKVVIAKDGIMRFAGEGYAANDAGPKSGVKAD